METQLLQGFRGLEMLENKYINNSSHNESSAFNFVSLFGGCLDINNLSFITQILRRFLSVFKGYKAFVTLVFLHIFLSFWVSFGLMKTKITIELTHQGSLDACSFLVTKGEITLYSNMVVANNDKRLACTRSLMKFYRHETEKFISNYDFVNHRLKT